MSAASPWRAGAPCSNCRQKHQKCDKTRPKCKQCEKKGLECVPVQRKAVFKHGSTANLDASFADDQTWVNSEPKGWKPPIATHHPASEVRQHASSVDAPLDSANGQIPHESPLAVEDDLTSVSCTNLFGSPTSERQHEDGQNASLFSRHQSRAKRRRVGNLISSDFFSYSPPDASTQTTANYPVDGESHFLTPVVADQGLHHGTNTGSSSEQSTNSPYQSSSFDGRCEPGHSLAHSTARKNPFSSVQESCLLRYFIEELSPWFDHCDERKHFQLVVPCRAQQCPTLRNALFAVSSRHLSRLPQYKTPSGIVYRGQSLPDITKYTAVEYFLKCIPDLVRFPDIQDPLEHENIMAAAVILRQYEEIDEDMEEGHVHANHERVNFLAITQTIIDSVISPPLDQSLAIAAYWIAVRQEVYYALTRRRAPHMLFGVEDWRNASVANALIMFAGDVARWCWGEKSPDEWGRLKLQQQQLVIDCMSQIEPILERRADRSKGEIFPTIWYSFDDQVTGAQHFEMARMILIAENPHLQNADRAAQRKAEANVRSIVLGLCGIALHHLRCQPALVNAVIAITLYGEYFTEQEERNALVEIIDRTKSIHAWPMREPYQILKQQWERVDFVEL